MLISRVVETDLYCYTNFNPMNVDRIDGMDGKAQAA